MKFLVYSDVQATEGHERCFSNPAIPLQRKRVEDFYRQIAEIAHEENVDGILDLGDTSDDRSSIPVPTLDSLLGMMEGLPTSHQNNYKLIGNHEQFVKSATIHVGRLYERYFTVIPDRLVQGFPGRGKEPAFNIVFCSFPAEEPALVDWLRRQSRERPTLLLGHFQTRGCTMNSGPSLSGVPVDALDWADLVLLGHVHKPQSVAKNVHYVGSPFQQNFGEAGEQKRVGIVDTSTMTVKWVPLPGFPEYLVLSAEDFFNRDWTASEDRIQVILTTPEETTQFYAHPLSHRYEPVYAYAAPEEVAAEVTAVSNNRDALMAKYLKHRPLKAANIILTTAEMLEFGQMLAVPTSHS